MFFSNCKSSVAIVMEVKEAYKRTMGGCCSRPYLHLWLRSIAFVQPITSQSFLIIQSWVFMRFLLGWGGCREPFHCRSKGKHVTGEMHSTTAFCASSHFETSGFFYLSCHPDLSCLYWNLLKSLGNNKHGKKWSITLMLRKLF